MVRIKWIILEDLSDVTVKEFDREWNGIYGYFELKVNEKSAGICPEKWKIHPDDEGQEDVLYWLKSLLKGVNEVKSGEEYRMELLHISGNSSAHGSNDSNASSWSTFPSLSISLGSSVFASEAGLTAEKHIFFFCHLFSHPIVLLVKGLYNCYKGAPMEP